MKILIDTNILLRSCEPDHPMFAPAKNTVKTLLAQGNNLYITPQNLIEFWNVCTRPKDKNGLGYSINEAQREVQKIKMMFPVLSDNALIYPEWECLVKHYEVKGVNVHDARLVAAMIVNKLTHIVTFNGRDFRRYTEITIIDPYA
ncbi:type II toxin-antitoxin system VapC family toxin [Synechocystis salina LEGE 06099]|uniref:type II toxin-antitoxin system VapC family toxin n=1 Tax=Synechocystis salina TaxID=945780 RepID=UPI0018812D1F|nr:type II toxin-antitoxin system VapC family toxin [Synechocystis salina]MBE9202869.1 type II toxin-antitoxin system VapC family toxin [Synechocystis salina LEGE 06099]